MKSTYVASLAVILSVTMMFFAFSDAFGKPQNLGEPLKPESHVDSRERPAPMTATLTFRCFTIDGENVKTCGLPEAEFKALIDAYNASAARAILLQKDIDSGCRNRT